MAAKTNRSMKTLGLFPLFAKENQDLNALGLKSDMVQEKPFMIIVCHPDLTITISKSKKFWK